MHRLFFSWPFHSIAIFDSTSYVIGPFCISSSPDVCGKERRVLINRLCCQSEFTKPWWTWMTLTGIFLSLTISCKMVGLFAFMAVGTAVVVDLWNLLDIKRGNSIEHVCQHFAARVLALIILPAMLYLFWFWVHFTILNKSGTGDEFMSPAFQQTLRDSPLMLNSEGWSLLLLRSHLEIQTDDYK